MEGDWHFEPPIGSLHNVKQVSNELCEVVETKVIHVVFSAQLDVSPSAMILKVDIDVFVMDNTCRNCIYRSGPDTRGNIV